MLGTFHAVALELMQSCRPCAVQQVIDEVETTQVLADVMANADVNLSLRETRSRISLVKTDPELAAPEALRDVYGAYQDRLGTLGVWDYDDILLEFLKLLRETDGVSQRVRQRFAHVLVDEFQDVNAVQYRLVTALAGAGSGLFVIGDPDQAIYGFRGRESRVFSEVA